MIFGWKKNVIVVIGIDWNCKYCFGLLELVIYIDRFCFILFFSWLMKILVVFFYFFESFIWIFFGIWIENLGCINFEKFGCLVLDIFWMNEWIIVLLFFRKIFFWIKIIKLLFFLLVYYFRFVEIELKKWLLYMLYYSYICVWIILR